MTYRRRKVTNWVFFYLFPNGLSLGCPFFQLNTLFSFQVSSRTRQGVNDAIFSKIFAEKLVKNGIFLLQILRKN
jgi:hypothetical protein